MARTPTIEVKFTGDTRGLEKATGRVEGELKGVGSKVSGFAVGAGAALTTMGAQAIPALVNFGKELFSLGQSSEIALAKSQTVFGESAGTIADWADGVNESLGLSDETVIGLAASMGDLLVPLGFTREAAAEMAMETTELSGALSAWSQGQYDAEQVSEILTKAMLGERDGLKALGISISQAEVDQKALTLANKDGRDAVTAQDKALATQQLVLEKSGDAQAAWSDGTMDAVKQQNELSASIADAKEGLAKGLVPIVQKVVGFITQSLIPAVKRAVATFKQNWPQIKAAVEPTMIQIGEIIRSVVELVTKIWQMFGDEILSVALFAFESIRKGVANAMQAIQGIIDIVMGVLSGDWSRVWSGISAVLDAVWEAMKGTLSNALAMFGAIFGLGWKAVKKLVSSAFSGLLSVIVKAVQGYIAYLKLLPGLIVSAIGSLGSLLYNAGRDLLGGLLRGMKDAAVGMFSWAGGIAGKIKNLKGPPSYDKVVLEGNGRLLIDGLLNGMKQTMPQLERFAQGIAPQLSASIGVGSTGLPASRSSRSSSTTIIQNLPVGVNPVNVTQARRQYARTQGPL